MGIQKVTRSRVVAVAAGASVLAVMAGGVGYAAGQIDSSDIKNHSIRGVDVKQKTLNARHISNNTLKRFQGKRGPAGADGQDGAALADSFSNFGNATVIQNLGGPFGSNATEVGTLELEAGQYLINGSAIFDTLAGNSERTEATHLQLAIRGPESTGNQWGDFGTCFTGAFPQGDREASCSTTRLMTLEEDEELTIYAFGYNEDQSSTGSGQFNVQVDVSAMAVN